MPGRTARSWAGPEPRRERLAKFGRCTVPASARPRSPAGCRSAEPRFAVFWPALFPGEIRPSHDATQAHRKDTKHRTTGHTETTISGDTRADWSEAFELVPALQIAYVWRASIF